MPTDVFALALLGLLLVASLALLARATLLWSGSRTENARLRAERDAARTEIERLRADSEANAARLRAELELLTGRIFDEKADRFRQMGTSAIAELVGPVRENLEKLQKSLVESEKADALREQGLRLALEQVGRINARLGSQAEDLARALKGDNRLVGEFGEEILRRVLEFSGLKQGIHFVEQGQDLALKDDSGRHLKPDVVIFLPEDRCLVVDSKMSLASWMDVQSADEAARETALRAFLRSIRSHVADLAGKPYTESVNASGRTTVDAKFLFVPVEAAFLACLQADRALYQDAFAQKVILVSPTTLLAVLTTVSHTWKQFEIGRNAQAISARAELFLDKLHDFFASMERVGEQLDKAQGAFEEARSRLSQGRGNLVGQARKLQELGVPSSKAIPKKMITNLEDDDGS